MNKIPDHFQKIIRLAAVEAMEKCYRREEERQKQEWWQQQDEDDEYTEAE